MDAERHLTRRCRHPHETGDDVANGWGVLGQDREFSLDERAMRPVASPVHSAASGVTISTFNDAMA